MLCVSWYAAIDSNLAVHPQDDIRDTLFEEGFCLLLMEALGRCSDKNQPILVSTILLFASNEIFRKRLLSECLFSLSKFISTTGVELELHAEAQEVLFDDVPIETAQVASTQEHLQRTSRILVQSRGVLLPNTAEVELAFSHASEFLDEEARELDRALESDLVKSARSSQLLASFMTSDAERVGLPETLPCRAKSTPANGLSEPQPRRPSNVPPLRPMSGPKGLPLPERSISTTSANIGTRPKGSLFSLPGAKKSVYKEEKKSRNNEPQSPPVRPKFTNQSSDGAIQPRSTNLSEQAVLANLPFEQTQGYRALSHSQSQGTLRKGTATPPRPQTEPRPINQNIKHLPCPPNPEPYQSNSAQLRSNFENNLEAPCDISSSRFYKTLPSSNDPSHSPLDNANSRDNLELVDPNFLFGNLFQDYEDDPQPGSSSHLSSLMSHYQGGNVLDNAFENLFSDYMGPTNSKIPLPNASYNPAQRSLHESPTPDPHITSASLNAQQRVNSRSGHYNPTKRSLTQGTFSRSLGTSPSLSPGRPGDDSRFTSPASVLRPNPKSQLPFNADKPGSASNQPKPIQTNQSAEQTLIEDAPSIFPDLLKDTQTAIDFNKIESITDLILSLETMGPPCLGEFLAHFKSHLIFIPRKEHYFWSSKNAINSNPLHIPKASEIEIQTGFSDVVLLSTIFAGACTPQMITMISDDQLYFYLFILIEYKGRNQQQVLAELSKRLSASRSCGLNFLFPGNPSEKFALSGTRAPNRLASTITWMNNNLANTGKHKLKEGMSWEGLDLLDPIAFIEEPITSIHLEKIFSSATKPLLLRLNSTEQNNVRVIFKRGDDLQQDHGVQAMFFLFNRLWQQSDLKYLPFIHQYRIVPMGPKVGVMEFVENCVPSGKFDWGKSLLAGAEPQNDARRMKFLCSMAGSYVACWILGIRDRHQDNMMIKDGHIFFHIDFGFIFNDAPGFDAPIFSIPRGVKNNLSSQEWNLFVNLCGEAFLVLHENAGLIMNVCTGIFADLQTVSVAQIRKFLQQSLMITENPTQAVKKIYSLVEEGISSTQKEIKYLMHDWAQKIAK